MTTIEKDPSPTPDEIKALRKRHGITQSQAAAILGITLNGFQRYEQDERKMKAAFWRLLRIQLGELKPKRK